MSETDRGSRLHRRLSRRVELARLALAWERLWPALWPAPLIAGIFLALALFDLLPRLPAWLHTLILVGLGALLLASLARAAFRFRWPRAAEGERRVEQASGLAHRPLAVLADRPATGGSDGAALWAAHQRRMAAMLRGLRVGLPHSGLLKRDPLALRIAAALALFVGVVIAGDTAGDRIARALTPGLDRSAKGPPVVDLWIEPPAYTGLAPIFAQPDRTKLTFPAGSTVIARVGGGGRLPSLLVDAEKTPFKDVGEGSFELKTPVQRGRRLSVLQGSGELAAWELEVTPDHPPTVALPRPPVETQRHALRIDYEAEDDYGLASLGAELRRVGEDGAVTDDAAVELPIPVSAMRARRTQGSTYRDLTAHAWAGQAVELRLVGKDGAGQTGMSAPVRFRLPEREFTHPVARAIIETRKKLADDAAARAAVSRRLGGIAQLTDMYDGDTVVFLALSAALWRLRHDESGQAIDAVRDLLWDTALRLEDGNLSIAERELREAQRELLEALSRDASKQEIDKLVERLWAEIQNYLQSMMAQAEDMPPLSEEEMRNMQVLEQQDLRDMLERMRELAESGSRDAAMQMLAQLQQMLENLRQARMAGRDGQRSSEMMRMMQQLQDLAGRQRGLLDETFRSQRGRPQSGRPQQGQPQPGQQGQPGQMPSLSDLAGRQDQLRRMLGEFMRQLGEQSGQIPNAFGRAEQAMRNAIEALQEQQAGEAVGAQSEALDQLQQAGRALAQEMARQMGLGQPQNQQTGQPDQQFDPLGRPPGGYGLNTQDVTIPEESDLQRARRIRDELYERSGDRRRPALERDYIDRLLQPF